MTRRAGRSVRLMAAVVATAALVAAAAMPGLAAAPDPAATDPASTGASTPKPAAKPAPKPAAKAATAKKAPAKATPAKATPAKATAAKKAPAKKTAAIAPASGTPKPAPARTERKIGEVVAVDDKDAGEIRLDGPWRDRGYPLRMWLTSYVDKQSGARRHQLSIQVTHHEEQPRNYVRAERADGAPALALVQTQRPSLQCTKNRDGSRQCFHTEAYLLDLPDEVLAKARTAGLTLTLAADQAESFAVPIDAATVDAQIKAAEAVSPIAVAAKKP